MKLSAVILSKDSEHTIERAIRSVAFCDEILIVDTESKDKTVSIATKLGAKVHTYKFNNNFSTMRNFALSKAKGSYVLFVDSDEVLSDALQEEIKAKKESISDSVAYRIKRRDFWWGRELRHGEVKDAYTKGFIRLVKRTTGQWYGVVHERFIPLSQKAKVDNFSNFINHYPHQSIKEFLADINFYSTLRAKELLDSGKKATIWTIIFYPFGKFWWNYLVRVGFLDGAAGFVYSFMMSFHSFLVRAKLYQYQDLNGNDKNT